MVTTKNAAPFLLPSKLLHTVTPVCVKKVLPDIFVEFILCQFPFMPPCSANRSHLEESLVVHFVNHVNEFESLNQNLKRF